MSIAARLAKLEATHKRILRCVWCRFALHDVPATKQKTYDSNSDSALLTKCWYCGTKYFVPLSGLNERQREAEILCYSSHPMKHFTDERVHAASIWCSIYGSEVEKYEKSKREINRPISAGENAEAGKSYNHTRGSLTLKMEKVKRDHEELMRLAIEFHKTQVERFRRLANGPTSFPVDETIEQIQHKFAAANDPAIEELLQRFGVERYSQTASILRSNLALCNFHLQRLKKREACEIVLWNQPLTETIEELEFFERDKQRLINEAFENR